MKPSENLTLNFSADTGVACAVACMMRPLVALGIIGPERAAAAIMRFVKVKVTSDGD